MQWDKRDRCEKTRDEKEDCEYEGGYVYRYRYVHSRVRRYTHVQGRLLSLFLENQKASPSWLLKYAIHT